MDIFVVDLWVLGFNSCKRPQPILFNLRRKLLEIKKNDCSSQLELWNKQLDVYIRINRSKTNDGSVGLKPNSFLCSFFSG